MISVMEPMRVSAEQRSTLRDNGFVVIHDVAPVDLCEAVIAAVCEFIGVDANDPATWHRNRVEGHGIVPLHHHPALWAVRQLPALHEVFTELYGTGALLVSMDRASFKAPASGWQDPVTMSRVHWDIDPRGKPRRRSYQGLIYLRDTSDEQGAFCCVPDIFRNLETWLAEHPETFDTRPGARRPIETDSMTQVGGPAGSMVIWDRCLPHSSGTNHGTLPRWVQYVTMDPADARRSPAERQERARLFDQKRPPPWALRQNVPGQLDPEPGPVAKLTDLGRKLAGLDDW
ncbi:MAG: phytanoyl-CoA dioxygenase family protein [Gammaproteobacteria bacterium]|nr:phytanoyl-CoA dioxygenase family protein [Gammaproteobacteria bacterium]